MAIDGVGIIDSDLSYDVYNLIMEQYYSGEPIEHIRNRVNEFHPTCCEFDEERYITAYALAMWEIGELTTKQLQDIRDLVSKGASIQWNNIHSNAQKERQRVLQKFLQKIEQPNRKIKQRKKLIDIENTLFSKGEVLAIPINNHYRCMIFEKFYTYKNDAFYSFVVTAYKSNVEPTIENILYEEIPVTKKQRQENRESEHLIFTINL